MLPMCFWLPASGWSRFPWGQGADTGKGGTLPLRQGAQGYGDEHGGLRGQRGGFLAVSMTAGIGEEELLQRAAAVSAANATTLESGKCASEAGGGNDEGY